jgi:bifunctional non-homologous end joining protein LigD
MRAMTAAPALSVMRDLRPQAYGTTAPGRILDPIVEPLWPGVRVLAGVALDETALLDETGGSIDDQAAIEASLAAAAEADAVILDGFLTKQVSHDGTGVYVGAAGVPPTGKLIVQSMIGTRRNRTAEAAEHVERELEARTFGPDDRVTFVAVDLLHLDGDSLLEVPLLERKRLLEAVLVESDLIRRGAYVRPPIDTWVNSWRALGFPGLSYKAANGRYRPGGVKDDWATSAMPRR